MGIRETVNQNPGITTGVTAGIIVVALGFIVWQNFGSDTPRAPSKYYYTDDDGKTTFADDLTKVPPFDHNGKQAVLAWTYSCDGGKTKFVAYLERYTPEAKAKLEKAKGPGGLEPGMAEELAMTGREVKKPGDKNWLKQTDRASQAVLQVKCPDGTTNNLERVLP